VIKPSHDEIAKAIYLRVKFAELQETLFKAASFCKSYDRAALAEAEIMGWMYALTANGEVRRNLDDVMRQIACIYKQHDMPEFFEKAFDSDEWGNS